MADPHEGSRCPKIRAPVSTCTIANTTAKLANQALAAIVDVKTDVAMSVYSELTLATIFAPK
jgi:hypothetical protein